MDSPSRLRSVFDNFDKLEHPTGSFDWEAPSPAFRFSKSDFVCAGELQEIDPITSAIHSTKHYAATCTHLLRYSVPFVFHDLSSVPTTPFPMPY